MANIFSASEIVEIASQIEKNGKDFYDALVDSTKDVKTREVFKFLAGEEEKHIDAFKKILDSVNKYEPAESYPKEYFAYMNALASEHVFTEKDRGKEVAKAIKSYKEAIDKAIGFEEDSIILYVGIKKVVPEHEHKIIEQLIDQEQDHMRQLYEVKAYLLRHPE